MYDLMERAGESAFRLVPLNWPDAKRILIIVGNGNNGGDGYVLARHAKTAGYQVTLCSPVAEKALTGDALHAQNAWFSEGGEVLAEAKIEYQRFDIVIDALLGTGLQGDVRAPFTDCITRINQSRLPVMSIDIPSGLHADNGSVLGHAVAADVTITFVGVKSGLITGTGKECTGTLFYEDLNIASAFASLVESNVSRIAFEDFLPLPKRRVNSHKGTFGRLLCIGGNRGMPGAIKLTGEAALRSGAGLVKVFCHHDSMLQVGAGRAELITSSDNLSQHLAWADCLVLGPGLGQDSWSRTIFNEVLSYLVHEDKPVVMDADGLNLLSSHIHKLKLSNLIITPHPAEASRLLQVSTKEVELNRFKHCQLLADNFNASCILKGAGSVIQSQNTTHVCEGGNPGMATAGMGDVLTGILGALLAQGMSGSDASLYGTCLHAAAGDLAAENGGQRGMLASDLYPFIRKLVNS